MASIDGTWQLWREQKGKGNQKDQKIEEKSSEESAGLSNAKQPIELGYLDGCFIEL